MQSILRRSFVRILAAGLVALVLTSTGCGGGGGDGGAYLTVQIVNDNAASSLHAITKLDFDYFDISLIPNRVETVLIEPQQGATFEFDSFQAESLASVTITWSDAASTFLPIAPFASSGGNLSYPVTH